MKQEKLVAELCKSIGMHDEAKFKRLLPQCVEAGILDESIPINPREFFKFQFERGIIDKRTLRMHAGRHTHYVSHPITPLETAIRCNNTEFARDILEAGADPNIHAWKEDSVLIQAYYKSVDRLDRDPEESAKLSELLLEFGAEPDPAKFVGQGTTRGGSDIHTIGHEVIRQIEASREGEPYLQFCKEVQESSDYITAALSAELLSEEERQNYQTLLTFYSSVLERENPTIIPTLRTMEREEKALTWEQLCLATEHNKPLLASIVKLGEFDQLVAHLNRTGAFLAEEFIKDSPVKDALCESGQIAALFRSGNSLLANAEAQRELFQSLPEETQKTLHQKLFDADLCIPVCRTFDGSYPLDLSATPLPDLRMLRAPDFTNHIYAGCSLEKSHQLEGLEENGATFIGSFMPGASLKNANCEIAEFQGAHWYGGDASQANLSQGNFQQAALMGTRFYEATIPHGNFTLCDARRTDFSQSNLTGAYFEGAKLDKADFKGAVVIGANFKDATGVDLSEAITTVSQLAEAITSTLNTKENEDPQLSSRGTVLLDAAGEILVGNVKLDETTTTEDVAHLRQVAEGYVRARPTKGGNIARSGFASLPKVQDIGQIQM